MSQSPADHRSRVIHELLVTERKYIQDLQRLQVDFYSFLIQELSK